MVNESKKVKQSPAVKIIEWIIKKALWFIIGSILFGLFFICTYWLWDWVILGAIATWILATGVIVAIIQIFDNRSQAKIHADEARQTAKAQITISLYDKLRSIETLETLETLRYVYSLDRKNLAVIFNEDRYRIENLIDQFSLLGALVNQRLFDESSPAKSYAGASVLRCWYQLASFIRETQNQRGYYGLDFEAFVRRTFDSFRDVDYVDVKFSNKYEPEGSLIEKLGEWIHDKDPLAPRSLDEIRNELKNNHTKRMAI